MVGTSVLRPCGRSRVINASDEPLRRDVEGLRETHDRREPRVPARALEQRNLGSMELRPDRELLLREPLLLAQLAQIGREDLMGSDHAGDGAQLATEHLQTKHSRWRAAIDSPCGAVG